MVRRRRSVFFMVVEAREASDGRPSYHNGTGKQWEKCGKCGERKFPLNGKMQNRGNVPATAFAGENLLAFLARIGIMGGVERHERKVDMATSSITDNFTISTKRAADAFADALDRAALGRPRKRRAKVAGLRVAGRDAVRRFLAGAVLEPAASPGT